MTDHQNRDWKADLVSPSKQQQATPPLSQPSRDNQKPKKLRFITNHGAPQAKRRRVSTACLTCRKRKVACSGERPACHTCTNNKLDCTGYSSENSNDHQSQTTPANQEIKPSTQPSKSKRKSVESGPGGSTTRQQVSSAPIRSCQSQANVQPPHRSHEQELPQRPTPSLLEASRNRMPYFRWLGPTAIMPGFKQMVVKINRASSTTNDAATSPSVNAGAATSGLSSADLDARTPVTLPFYDSSSMPPSELIAHLCETFFTHLGCNFPFLQRDRFMKDLQEKQVDAILVDAVCALAARFSTHEIIVHQPTDNPATSPSEHGSAFAQRAKLALIDMYATPSISAVQAALLIAYNEFGESRDSGLWMYLGISIRLAQDLGLHKLDGLCYEGRDGSTPRFMDNPHESGEIKSAAAGPGLVRNDHVDDEQRAAEKERVDTFWAVFFLDRVVSSGTGRRGTLQESDIELSFPSQDTTDSKSGWPLPFPALIRIVCLYGRVTDLLNAIKEPSDINEDTPQALADIEARVTNFYQSLPPKLHFQAMNFHHYVKAGEGTNFVLLHFWFHTLIILLHQPTLLKTFEGPILQLFPNSQALSMSSAKTIADILSYSQLIDTKAGLGNPFTTQPIYVAACAFLKETAEQTATSKEHSRSQSSVVSRAGSPCGDKAEAGSIPSDVGILSRQAAINGRPPMVERALARHTLLATAANQHYQLCYKALQSLETYWAGTKYILTVLDQKFKGVGDPLLYTAEEGESSLEQPQPKPSFTTPGWRRKYNWTSSTFNGFQNPFMPTKSSDKREGSPSPSSDTNQPIGWTLTGTLNSPNTNVAWHFPNIEPMHSMESVMNPFDFSPDMSHNSQEILPPQQIQHARTLSGSLPRTQNRLHRPSLPAFTSQPAPTLPTLSDLATGPDALHIPTFSHQPYDLDPTTFASTDQTSFGDLLIETQDVDMSLLGLDMLPWFDATSGDMLPVFDTEEEGFGDVG